MLCAPLNHRDGVMHQTRGAADADREHFDGRTIESQTMSASRGEAAPAVVLSHGAPRPSGDVDVGVRADKCCTRSRGVRNRLFRLVAWWGACA